MENKEITESIGQMIDSKDLANIQLASAIIKAQPDMIDSNALKGHWYNINDIITDETVKYVELYYHGGSSDKVYIINFKCVNKNNIIEVHYGRRGKKLIVDNKGSFLYRPLADRKFDGLIKNKIKKGYIKIE